MASRKPGKKAVGKRGMCRLSGPPTTGGTGGLGVAFARFVASGFYRGAFAPGFEVQGLMHGNR